MNKNGLRDMTTGSPAGHILYFALPLLVGSLLQQFYNMVDSWVVGQYVGDAALAAVGVGFPVLTMFSSLFIGLSNGGTVIIAQFFGAGKLDRVREAVDTIYTAFLLSIVPLTALALLAVRPILFLLQVEAGAFEEARLYLTVVCAGLIGSVGYNLNAGILGGLGNSRSTLLFLAVASAMNIVLDLVLVLSFGLGVLGVALGTIIAQAFSWLFGVFYINRHYPEIRLRLLPRSGPIPDRLNQSIPLPFYTPSFFSTFSVFLRIPVPAYYAGGLSVPVKCTDVKSSPKANILLLGCRHKISLHC